MSMTARGYATPTEALETPLLTIICPVYNEELALPLFFERVHPVIEELSSRYTVHLVFLNNGSTDRTAEEIQKVKTIWPFTYMITTSRNVSYHASLECGLRNVHGDVLIIIDVDCEDPPELIPSFIEKYEQGYDVVYGERVDREEPGWIKRARKIFYRVLRAVADEDIILDMAEFSLFTNDVREAILDECTSFPFIRASIGRVGFRRIAIPFKRQKRVAGNSHYNLLGMSVFAIGGILSASTLFLGLPIYLLPLWLFALISLAAGYAKTQSLWFAAGAFSVFAAYIGGTAAFTALYIARTYKNSLGRPNAFINRKTTILQPRHEGDSSSALSNESSQRFWRSLERQYEY